MNQEKPEWADEWEWRGSWVRRFRPDIQGRRRDDAGPDEEPYSSVPWGPGPWDEEPDKVVWHTPELPFALMVCRNTFGALCGYVGVGPAHPLYRTRYQEVDEHFDCHGGLTFSDACEPPICHQAPPGQPDHVWWFGFDCAHFGDDYPGMSSDRRSQYRDLGYVRREVEGLARQLLDIQQGGPVRGGSR